MVMVRGRVRLGLGFCRFSGLSHRANIGPGVGPLQNYNEPDLTLLFLGGLKHPPL